MIMSTVTDCSPLQSAGGRSFVLIMRRFQHGRLPGFHFGVCFAEKIGSRKAGVPHVHVTHGYCPLDVIIVILIGGQSEERVLWFG